MNDNNQTSNPNLKTILAIAGLAILMLGLLILFILGGFNKPVTNNANKETKTNDAKEAMQMSSSNPSSSAMKVETMQEMQNKKAGEYKNYDPSELSHAKDGHSVVLFFNAAWCPTCQATVKEINSNLDKIDPTVHILSVDYDTNVALRQKYGVTFQHTFVSVDKDGNIIKKASGLKNVDEINNFVK